MEDSFTSDPCRSAAAQAKLAAQARLSKLGLSTRQIAEAPLSEADFGLSAEDRAADRAASAEGFFADLVGCDEVQSNFELPQ